MIFILYVQKYNLFVSLQIYDVWILFFFDIGKIKNAAMQSFSTNYLHLITEF